MQVNRKWHGKALGLTFFGTLIFFVSTPSWAADSKTLIMLGGENCGSFQAEISKNLKEIKGVKNIDFNDTPGHVLIEHDASVKPEALADKINSVKGSKDGKDGFCKAEIMD